MLRLSVSIVLGFLLGLCNLYIALRIGFTVGVALLTVFCWASVNRLAAYLPMVWRKVALDDYACYLSLTSAMSCGSATVIATSLAAVMLSVPEQPALWVMMMWVAGLCGLGTCLAFPLRVTMLNNYPFPSGKVAGDLVSKLEGHGRLTPFLGTMALVWAWMGLGRLFPAIPQQLTLFKKFLEFSFSPMLIGLGALLGPHLTLSMMAGSCFFFGVLPLGWPSWEGEALWLAIGMMVSATLFEFSGFLTAQRKGREMGTDGSSKFKLAGRSYWGALLASITLLVIAYVWGWGIPIMWLLLLLPLMILFAYTTIAVTGQTDVVPTGALGKLSLLFFSFLPSPPFAAMVHTGSLTGGAAAAADFMTDLRCGQQLGCSPARQFRYQFAGALLGPLLFVPTFVLLISGDHVLGGDRFPVPAARIWLAVAGLTDALAVHGNAILIGLALGLIMQLLHRMPTAGRFFPAPLSFAMAAMLDPATCGALALGGLVGLAARKDTAMPLFSAMVCADSVATLLLILWN